MDPNEVLSWLDEGLARFTDQECDLELDVNERALTGRLLVHLDAALVAHHPHWLDQGWRLDTEYNKVGRFTKRLADLDLILDDLEDQLGWSRGTIPRRATNRVAPDIILHHRGSGYADNGVVCEVKRSTMAIEELAFDVGKLVGFRQYLNYEFACLILLARDRDRCSTLSIGDDVATSAAVVRLIAEARAVGAVPGSAD